jgi:hypothetical protein
MKRQPQQCQDRIVDLIFIDIHALTLPRAVTEILRPSSDAYHSMRVGAAQDLCKRGSDHTYFTAV